ncbi:MAG: hypothetical protein IJJ69_00955 [Oscillospiraceae bacterium]|nr:hypothetical protein [Oscillospiraceae bacterium]
MKSEKVQNRNIFRIVRRIVIFLIILLLGWCAYLRYYARLNFSSLEVKAKTVYYASQVWQKDGHTLTTSSGTCTDAPFSEYFSDDNYYAIVCDEQGNLQYALYSHKEIRNLNQPDGMEEYQKLNLPVLCWYVVGSYPPKGNSPFT